MTVPTIQTKRTGVPGWVRVTGRTSWRKSREVSSLMTARAVQANVGSRQREASGIVIESGTTP